MEVQTPHHELTCLERGIQATPVSAYDMRLNGGWVGDSNPRGACAQQVSSSSCGVRIRLPPSVKA